MGFLGLHLVTFLSTLSPYFPCALQTYKAFMSYLLLHFLMKLIFVSFPFFFFSCDIYLWYVGWSLLFFSITFSFCLYTGIHNSLNFTCLKEFNVLSTNLFLGFKYWQIEHQNGPLNCIMSSMPSLSLVVRKWSRMTFSLLRFCIFYMIHWSQ